MNFQNIKLSTLSPGTYTIKAIFDGDDTYEAAETEFTLIIDANNEAHVVIPDSGSAEQGAKRHPSLAFAGDEIKTEVTSHKYQLQMPANPNMLDLVWSCNNSSVSIDATGKTITIPNAPATCTITASFSGNSLYYAASASYTLTIEEANSGSSTPTPTPTPSEEEEDDPTYYNLYFENQMEYEVRDGTDYRLQMPKTTETQSGEVPQNIRECCYFTIDDWPTEFSLQSNHQLPLGTHIVTLHFTGTEVYHAYNIAYTITVGTTEQIANLKKLNLKFSAASYSYDGTGEARYTFSYDTQYQVSTNRFSITVDDLTDSYTYPRTSSYSFTDKYVVLDTSSLVRGHEYEIEIRFEGDSHYKAATATTRVLYDTEQHVMLSFANALNTYSETLNEYYTIPLICNYDPSKVSSSDFECNYSYGDDMMGTIDSNHIQISISGDSSSLTVLLSPSFNLPVTYSLELVFKGNEYYERANTTTTVTISSSSQQKLYVDLSFSESNYEFNETGTHTLYFAHNMPDITGYEMYFNCYATDIQTGTVINGTVGLIGGYVTLALPNTHSYIVTLELLENDRYYFASTQTTVTIQQGGVNPQPQQTIDPPAQTYYSQYLTFEALENNVNIYFNGVYNTGYDIDYSYDSNNWSTFRIGNGGYNTYNIKLLSSGNKLYVRSNIVSGFNVGGLRITTGRVKVYGNIMSLINKNNFSNLDTLTNGHEFEDLFRDSDIVDASNLVLPAIYLSGRCYYEMFYGCTSLTKAPYLPTAYLDVGCYSGMFQNCTSLTIAPSVLSSSLAKECCEDMFSGCTSLTTVQSILPATTLKEECYSNMFRGCTSLTTAPELPATTLADSCYYYMFYGCTSLQRAPELPATTLVHWCYHSMFYDCTSLNYVKAMFTTNIPSNYTNSWLRNVSSSGTFVKNANATWDEIGVSGIPSGWTVVNA